VNFNALLLIPHIVQLLDNVPKSSTIPVERGGLVQLFR
jgi:hypothetical protein